VKYLSSTWRTAARVLVLALVVTAIPLPSLAGDVSKPAPSPLKASIAKAAKTNIGALEQAKPAQPSQPADKSELGSPSFFKKPAGIVVLALVGGGIGYMAYSMSQDRIHSAAR